MPVQFKDPKTGQVRTAADKFDEQGNNITRQRLVEKGYTPIEATIAAPPTPPTQDPSKPSKLESLAYGAATGFASPTDLDKGESLYDEAAGFVSSLVKGTSYEEERKQSYKNVQAAKKANPEAFEAGTYGGIATNVAAHVGLAIAGGAPSFVADLILSSLMAGVSGYTEGDPDVEKSTEERLKRGAQEAGLTAGIMGATAGVGKGLSVVAKKTKKALANTPSAIKRATQEAAFEANDAKVATLLEARMAEEQNLLSAMKKVLTKAPNDKLKMSKAERLVVGARRAKSDAKTNEEFLKKQAKALAKELGLEKGESPQATLEFVKNKMVLQPGLVEEQWLGRVKNKLRTEVVPEQASKDFIEKNVRDDGRFLTSMFRWASDGRWILADLDDKFGTKLAPYMDRVSGALRQKALLRASISKEATELATFAKKAGVDISETSEQLWHYMNGDVPVPAQHQEAVTRARGIFDRLFNFQQEAGTQITKREDYITHTLKSIDQRYLATRQHAAKVQQELGGLPLTIENAQTLDSGRQLIKGLENLEGGKFKFNVNTPDAEFQRLLKRHTEIPDPKEMDTFLENENSIFQYALERTDDMPEFLMEKDIFKILSKYAHHAGHNALVEPALAPLRTEARYLNKLGAKKGARFVQQHINQLQKGQPVKGTWGAFQRFTKQTEFKHRLKYAALYEKAKSDGRNVSAGFYKLAYQAPDMWKGVVSSIYAKLLGSPRQVLVNLSGSFTMGIPELGVKEFSRAYSRVLKKAMDPRGIIDTIIDPSTAQRLGKKVGDTHLFKSVEEWAQARTYIAPESHRNAKLGIEEGVREGLAPGLQQVASVNRAIDNASMYLFAKAEVLNRAVASEAGRDIAQRMASGTLNARFQQKILNKMDSGYRRELNMLMRAGNVEGMEKLLSEYYVGKIALNYDKAQAAFFARNLGTLFSMFSKWPSHVMGEMAYKARNRGAAEAAMDVTSKYLMPLIVLGAVGVPLRELMGDTRYEAITGSRGLAGWAPGTSITGFATAEQFTPLPMDVLNEMMTNIGRINSDDPIPGAVAVANGILKYVGPGAQIFRMITVDLPAMIEGDSAGTLPRKSDMIGQIVSIAEGMN